MFYFNEHIAELDPIEGVWRCEYNSLVTNPNGTVNHTLSNTSNSNCVIIKINSVYYECDINEKTGTTKDSYEINGEHIVFRHTFEKTAVRGVYIYNFTMYTNGVKDEENESTNAFLNGNVLKRTYSSETFSKDNPSVIIWNTDQISNYLKLYPSIGRNYKKVS